MNDVTAGVKELTTDNNQVLKLTLRIRLVYKTEFLSNIFCHRYLFRNAQGDLHDIKFEFNKASETVPDVVSEMVSASLIDERDAHAGRYIFFQCLNALHFHSSYFHDE
jgi:hypothetical protein